MVLSKRPEDPEIARDALLSKRGGHAPESVLKVSALDLVADRQSRTEPTVLDKTRPRRCRLDVDVRPESEAVDNGFLTPTLKIKRAIVEGTYSPHFQAWGSRSGEVFWQE